MILWLLMVLLLAIVLYSWITLIVDTKRTGIPGPTPIPVLGNGHLFLGDSAKFLETMTELVARYGGVFRMHVLHTRYVVLSHPRYLEALLTSNELITKGNSYKLTEPWLGQGLLVTTGHKWKTYRKLLTPAFHFNILRTFMPVFIEKQHILRQNLYKIANGSSFDIHPMIALAALDIISESIMGVSLNAQADSKSKYVLAVEQMCQIITARMRNPFLISDRSFNLMPHKRIQDKALEVLHGQANKVIEARYNALKHCNEIDKQDDDNIGIKNKTPFLDLLLKATIDGERLDYESIREEVDTFMFAGHDTTASAISFCLYCVSNHKEVQQKLLDEQKEILGEEMGRDPTFIELKQMKYLGLVIRESLRLYPAVPFVERLIVKDTSLEGIFLPKDTTITLSIFHMHRDPLLYEEPLKFKPERFDMESAELKSFNWLAFSAGPRNCIGQNYAMMEMKVIISSIVRHFQILPAGIEAQLCIDVTLRSANGVNIKLLPRS